MKSRPDRPLTSRSGRAAALLVLVCLTFLAAAARAHFTVDSVDRYFVVTEEDGRLLARVRVPLPFLLAAELDAAARAGTPASAPVLGAVPGPNGPDLVLRPDLVTRHRDYFTDLMARAHEWRVGAAVARPRVLRWRVALMSQEAALPFGREARKILSLPSLAGPAPLGQALVDFELDLGPARPERVSVRFALPPLQLPPGITVANNLRDAVARPPVARTVAGQMTAPEVIVMPPRDQARTGAAAGLRQGAAGLAGAMLAAGVATGSLHPAAAAWMLAGLALGLWGAPIAALGDALRPFLPLGSALLTGAWAALAAFARPAPLVTRGLALLLGMGLGAAGGTEWLAPQDAAALRPLLRWAFAGGVLAAAAGAILAGLALRRLAPRMTLPPYAPAAAVLAAVLGLAGMQTAQAVTARVLADVDPVLRLPASEAQDRGFELISTLLAELHRAVQTGPEAVARLVEGNPATVLGAAAARLAETGLPPTEPDLHEVTLEAFRMRASGRRLDVAASWQVLGLRTKAGHEHVKGARFAAEIALHRSWGRWRIAAFDLAP